LPEDWQRKYHVSGDKMQHIEKMIGFIDDGYKRWGSHDEEIPIPDDILQRMTQDVKGFNKFMEEIVQGGKNEQKLRKEYDDEHQKYAEAWDVLPEDWQRKYHVSGDKMQHIERMIAIIDDGYKRWGSLDEEIPDDILQRMTQDVKGFNKFMEEIVQGGKNEQKLRKEYLDAHKGHLAYHDLLANMSALNKKYELKDVRHIKDTMARIDQDNKMFRRHGDIPARDLKNITQTIKQFNEFMTKVKPKKDERQKYQEALDALEDEHQKYTEEWDALPKDRWGEEVDWDAWEDKYKVSKNNKKKAKDLMARIDRDHSMRDAREDIPLGDLQKMTETVKEFNKLIKEAQTPKPIKPSVPNKNTHSAASAPEKSVWKISVLKTKIKEELNLLRDTVNKLNQGVKDVVSEEHVAELKSMEDKFKPQPNEDGTKKVTPSKEDLQTLHGKIAPFRERLKNDYPDFDSTYNTIYDDDDDDLPLRKREKKQKNDNKTELQQLKKLFKKAIGEAEGKLKEKHEISLDYANEIIGRQIPRSDKAVQDMLDKIQKLHKEFLNVAEYKDAYEKESKPKPTARRGPKTMDRSVENQDLFNDLRTKYRYYKKQAKSNQNDDKFEKKFKDYSKATYSQDEKNPDIRDFIQELDKAIDEEESTKSSKATVHKDLHRAQNDYKTRYDGVPLLFAKITNTSDREKYMREFAEFPNYWKLESVQEANDQFEKVLKFTEKVNAAASQDKTAGHKKKDGYIDDPDNSSA